MSRYSAPPTNAITNINAFSIRLCPSGVFHLQFEAANISVSEEVFLKMAETMDRASTDVIKMRLLKSPKDDSPGEVVTGPLPENVVTLRK